MSDNIYLELELFLDPAITDSVALKAELEAKISEWNKRVVSNPKYKSKIARTRKFIKDGLSELSELANEARIERLNQLRYAIQQQKFAGKIGESGFKKLKDLFPCFSEETIKLESEFAGDSTFQPPIIPPTLKCDRIIPPIEMESVNTDLSIIENGRFANLYELLELTESASTNDLYKKALEEGEKNRRVAAKTPEVDAKNRLLGKAAHYFKDDYERLNYDVALQRSRFDKLCLESFQHRAIKGIITSEIYELSINDAVAKGLTRKEAEYLVYEYYCVKMKCPPPISLNVTTTHNTNPEKPTNFWSIFAKQTPQPSRPRIEHSTEPIDNTKSITVADEPTLLLESFQFNDIRDAITPINENNLPIIWNDKVFWFASVISVVPLGITAMKQEFLDTIIQFAFGLACLVGLLVVCGQLIRRVIFRSSEDIRIPVAAFFVTALITIPAFMLFCQCFPEQWLTNIVVTENKFYLLLKLIFFNGIFEEIIKIIPVLAYLLYQRQKASMKLTFLIGFLSSLGLIAVKLIMMWSVQDVGSWSNLLHLLTVDIMYPVAPSWVLKVISLVIANAVWTAIFAYYCSCAMIAGKQWIKFLLIGFGISSFLHGFYVWLGADFPGFAALVIGTSFVLFYGYLAKIRSQITQAT